MVGLPINKDALGDQKARMLMMQASYAGPNAETADHTKQKEMQSSIAAGDDKYKTFDKTGWFVGPDNIPRFEIDDSKAKFDWSKITKAGDEVLLKDIMDHPTLYDAYPQLKGVKVKLGNDLPYSTAGTATEGDRSIEFGPMGRKTPGLLLHEVQHLIQRIEGTARGASFADPNYRRSAGEQEAYDTMYRFLEPKRKKDTKGWGGDDPRYKDKPYTKGKYPHLLKAQDDPTAGIANGGPMIIELGKKLPNPANLPAQMTAPIGSLERDIQYLKALP